VGRITLKALPNHAEAANSAKRLQLEAARMLEFEWVDKNWIGSIQAFCERPSLLSVATGEIRVTTSYRGFPVEGKSL
jgi:hypothetical protein